MKKNRSMILLIALLTVALCVLVVVATLLDPSGQEENNDPSTQPSLETTPSTKPTETEPPPTTQPTEPPIVKEATATIGATGDILFHDLVIQSGYNSATGTYNYDEIFPFFSQYVSKMDYAVANLEVTLCGSDNGYAYKGYPCFNSPDAVADALKKAGFDMLLTANNHSYDTRNVGFLRTQQVIKDRGLDYIGTRTDPNDANYIVKDINGIKVGMVCYTYNTQQDENGKIYLNGIPLTVEDSKLVNSFNYYQLDSFYSRLSGQLAEMKSLGAEATVLFIHWGDEYQTTPNSHQTKMAQALCDLGIDVIMGNHAHVPQPVELLTSKEDENHKTLCLYSTGNSISNIYETSKFPVNTEDGMLFSFTFAKYSDGTVVVESADVLPTWVWRSYDENWVRKFTVLTMDDDVEDWQSAMNLPDEQLQECKDSYKRTMDIVGPGLTAANEWFAQNQATVEAQLGVEIAG